MKTDPNEAGRSRETVSGSGEITVAQEFPVADWDKYQFIQLLGKGGMGEVYKAFDPKLQRFVALKFIQGNSPAMTERFLREARAQARIEHDYVCKIHEVGEVQGKSYISMQFIEGQTLKDVQHSATPFEKVLLIKKVAEAIHAAHKCGLIHRDIKPLNIMVTRNEKNELRPYVMDFGLAREMDSAGVTSTGIIVGTPWYLSPEQARGDAANVGPLTDVYSLGATLYELLSGGPPFTGASPLDIVVKVLQENPPRLKDRGVDVPPALESLVMKCLEKDPQQRPPSAQAFAEQLQGVLDSMQTSQAAGPKPGRKMIAAIFALLVIGLMWAVLDQSFKKPAADRKQEAVLAPKDTTSTKFISVDFMQTGLRDALKQIADQAGVDAEIDSQIKGSTTLNLRQVPWEDCVKILCRKHLLDYSVEGHTLKVSIPTDPGIPKGTPISIHCDNCDLKDFFVDFAARAGLKATVDQGLSGRITAHVEERPWGQVLSGVSLYNSIDYSIHGTQLKIAPPAPFQSGEPLSFEFKDIELPDLFHFFGDTTGLNVILDPEVKGKTTISVVDLPWEKALQLICKNNDLGYTVDGKNVRIAPLKKLLQEEQEEKYRPPIH